MADDLVHKIGTIGGRLKINGVEVGRKVTSRMSSMSFKMKGFFQGQTQEDKIVEAATSETLKCPDWSANFEVCDMVNTENVNRVIRSIKRRIATRNSRVQYLSLVLLETCAKNCDKAFAEAAAAEGVVDEMVGLIDDPQTAVNNRNKALGIIESWRGSVYKGLKSRGIQFPGNGCESLAPIFAPLHPVLESAPDAEFRERTNEAFNVARDSIELLSTVLSSTQQDAMTDTLVNRCHECQLTIHKIIETALGGGNDGESVLFEALNWSDSLQKILTKYEESRFCNISTTEPSDLHLRLDNERMMDELDKIIFGNKGSNSVDVRNKSQNSNSNRRILTVT